MLNRRQLLLGCPAFLSLGVGLAEAAGQCSERDEQGRRECVVGLEIGSIETVRQRCEQWCWAACVQAVFALRGHDVAQEEAVIKIFGGPICEPATSDQILAAIDGEWVDAYGFQFSARAQRLPDIGMGTFTGAGFRDIINELNAGNPLINGAVGHATVMTAAHFIEDQHGLPYITDFVVRDPWPDSPNRRVLSAREIFDSSFLAKVSVY